MTERVAKLKVPPVDRSILVACSPDRAFRAFTGEIAAWWPIETHSISQRNGTKVCLEAGVGGRVYEISEDGQEYDWGRILEWSPPRHFSMTWHPGRSSDTHQVLEVRFSSEADGTHVHLIHRGWEMLGEAAQAKRDDYDGGWSKILEQDFAHYLAQIRRSGEEPGLLSEH